jgi:polysaccharide export outer membrane protein
MDLKDEDSSSGPKIITQASFTDPRIQHYDILQVTVQTMMDNNVTKVFEESGDATTKGSIKGNTGYLVDKDGFIELPLLGRLKVVGLTLYDARELIREKAQKYYVDPIIKVSYLNFYVTVLGDVGSPGRKLFETEKVSILDLLSEAGDMSITAKRENVLVIRETGGHKTAARIDMNSSKIFQSPYFYLQSGDVVYIEPNKATARTATLDRSRDRYLTYVTSGLSIILSVYTILLRTQ